MDTFYILICFFCLLSHCFFSFGLKYSGNTYNKNQTYSIFLRRAMKIPLFSHLCFQDVYCILKTNVNWHVSEESREMQTLCWPFYITACFPTCKNLSEDFKLGGTQMTVSDFGAKLPLQHRLSSQHHIFH